MMEVDYGRHPSAFSQSVDVPCVFAFFTPILGFTDIKIRIANHSKCVYFFQRLHFIGGALRLRGVQ